MNFEESLITSLIPENKNEFNINVTNCKTKIIEHRLDGLIDPENFQIDYYKYDFDFLVAMRPQNPKATNYLSEIERVQFLKQAIDSGAKMVDIEIETSKNLVEELLRYAKKKQVIAIISYHNYMETPDNQVLEDIVQKMNKTGADIIKCVTTANDYTDAHRIIDVQIKWSRKIMAFAMGTFGSYSRVLSLLHNAPYAYVPLTKKTAPGQLSIDDFKTIFTLLT